MNPSLLKKTRLGGPVRAAVSSHKHQDGTVLGDSAAVFDSWRDSDWSLAVWRRESPENIRVLLQQLRLEQISGFRITVSAQDARRQLAGAVERCGIEPPLLRQYLAEDFALLAHKFSSCTGTQQLELRLERITGDACRRYHIDCMAARLVVTYVGPGTVYAPASHGLDALREQQGYCGPAREIPTFWASLFAGDASDRPGLVHRSPQIAGTGQARLFYCVNQA